MLSSVLDVFVVFLVSRSPVAMLPGFFFAPAVLRFCSGCGLLRNCYVFVKFL